MKRILFVGACEKSDLLVYISKVLTTAGHKVLLIDATMLQRYFYSIPAISLETKLTEYDGFDVIRDCIDYRDVETCFANNKEDLEAYDFVLIDTDCEAAVSNWGDLDMQFIVSNFERYTVEKNERLLNAFFADREKSLTEFELIIYPFVKCNLDEKYPIQNLDHFPISWSEEPFEFYLEESDYIVRVNNQHDSRVSIKKSSRYTKNEIMAICQLISGQSQKEIKTAFRAAERNK
ncbi:hypothetical protein [Paenibacillus agilis]|uniref:Uncharacterized protein n=1 Tax=Paenibacillus agilis TaxID=3020863 RepID=A0A559IDL4_9BACL|nr:hypothetical protein [Paenibacillus agilis]TVX85620.1 hypothetical protein FPZ44_25035 [Paenibacillus agilis]